MSRIGPNLFTILRHEFSSHDHHPTFHSRETSTLLLSSTLPLIARFLFLYIYIYRRSSNEATTRRGGRSPPSPPFQLSFRGIESPPNRFPARENYGRNIGNFEICSLPPKLLVYPSRERLRTDRNATGSGFGRLISFLE